MDNLSELKQKRGSLRREHGVTPSQGPAPIARRERRLREEGSAGEMAGPLELVRQGHRDQADLTSMLDTIDPDLVRLTREVVLCQRAALLRAQATAQAEFERALGVRAHVEDRFGRGLASAAEREAAEAALRRADAALDSASAELAAFDTISIPDRARQLVLRVAATDEACEDG